MSHPIPAGYHSITPHLLIKGAAEAIEFYKKAFGAQEVSRTPLPGKGGQIKIGHAELMIGDSRLFLADERPHCVAFRQERWRSGHCRPFRQSEAWRDSGKAGISRQGAKLAECSRARPLCIRRTIGQNEGG
ncbi:MAG: hypothetical protein ACP5XB_04115 [Isosphaeraceae bacterium]